MISFRKTKANILKRMIVIHFIRYFKHFVKFSLTSDKLKSSYGCKGVKVSPIFHTSSTRSLWQIRAVVPELEIKSRVHKNAQNALIPMIFANSCGVPEI